MRLSGTVSTLCTPSSRLVDESCSSMWTAEGMHVLCAGTTRFRYP